ncbi:hypothetical protein ABE425_05585 [Chryseobacterium cucumeris]
MKTAQEIDNEDYFKNRSAIKYPLPTTSSGSAIEIRIKGQAKILK